MSTTPDELANFPEAAEDDPDDVRWALETGKAMWSQGNRQEGLKWLKRAAESASEEGADMRAVELAKAAAERRSMLEQPAEQAPAEEQAPPAPAPAAGPSGRPPPPPRRSGPGQGRAALPSPPRRSGAAPSPPRRPGTSGAPPARPSTPAPPAKRSAPEASPQELVESPPAPTVGSVPPRPTSAAIPFSPSPSAAPPAPGGQEAAAAVQATPSAPPAPRAPAALGDDSATAEELSPDSSPTAVHLEAPPVPAPEPAARPSAPAAPSSADAASADGAAEPATERIAATSHHHAVRVAVSAGSALGELRAVVLSAEQPVPQGSHEALLVALDPSVNLVAPQN